MGAEDEGVDAFVIFGEDGREFLLFVDVSVDQAAADADDTVGREKGVERIDLRLPSNFVAGGRRVDLQATQASQFRRIVAVLNRADQDFFRLSDVSAADVRHVFEVSS